MTPPVLNEDELAKAAAKAASEGRLAKHGEPTRQVVEPIPERIGAQYTAHGLAIWLTSELGKEVTAQEVLALDGRGKLKSDDVVNKKNVLSALKSLEDIFSSAEPRALIEEQAVESNLVSDDVDEDDQSDPASDWIDVLQILLLVCQLPEVGEFVRRGGRTVYRPSNITTAHVNDSGLIAHYPSIIKGDDDDVVIFVPDGQYVNPQDEQAVLKALDDNWGDYDARLVSKQYDTELAQQWEGCVDGIDRISFKAVFDRAVGEVFEVAVRSGRNNYARRMALIQLLSQSATVEALLQLSPQQLIELDPYRAVQQPPPRKSVVAPPARVVAPKPVAVAPEVMAEVQPEPEVVATTSVPSEAEVAEAFDAATDAFLDSLEATGLLDVLSDEQIAVAFLRLIE